MNSDIETGASLQLYAPRRRHHRWQWGDEWRQSLTTANQPVSFQIWGTKTTGVQSIDIKGNGVLSGIVYAPQGSVKINGNGDVMGSIVANDITLVGDATFHYDESLANFGGNNPFRVSIWKELTSQSQRTPYITALGW